MKGRKGREIATENRWWFWFAIALPCPARSVSVSLSLSAHSLPLPLATARGRGGACCCTPPNCPAPRALLRPRRRCAIASDRRSISVACAHVTCYPFMRACVNLRCLGPFRRAVAVDQCWAVISKTGGGVGCLCASLTRRDPPRPGGNRKEVRRTTWFRKHTTSSQRVGLATWAWSASGSFVLHRIPLQCNKSGAEPEHIRMASEMFRNILFN